MDLVIPALDRFSREAGLSEERASAIVSAIANSKFWRKWRRCIAANQKWVRTIGKEGLVWKMIGSEATLTIPRPPGNDPDRPWRVFPELDVSFAHGVLLDANAQNLIVNESDLGWWDEAQVKHQLSTVDVGGVFSYAAESDYLAAFLEILRPAVLSHREVQDALCDLLRRAVRAKGLHGLSGVAERVRRIAALISRERKLRITLRTTGVAVAGMLVLQPTASLAWPQDLDSGEANSNPEPDDIEILLRALADENDHPDSRRQYAEDLLKQLQSAQRRELLSKAGDLAVLSAFDCRRGQKTSVSANQLRELWARRTLFRAIQGISDRDRAGLGVVLQTVLVDEPVLVVNRDLARLVFDDETAEIIPDCDSGGVLHCLAHLPRRLGDSRSRRELLRRVRLPGGDSIAIKGLRFLLHADSNHLGSDAPLWVEQGEGASAWRKMWQAVVPLSDSWTVVAPEITDQMVRADWKAIDLRAISPDEVARLIADEGPIELDSVRLEDSEYDAILGYERWDARTWASLPFHLTNAGNRVPIGDRDAFLEQTGVSLPAELLSRTNVMVRSSDPRIAVLQDQRIPKLDYEAAILIAIQDDTPQRWFESILDWITTVTLSGALVRELIGKPWLRMKSGRAVKPTDFVLLPEVENHVTLIARQSQAFGTLSLLPEELQTHHGFDQLKDSLFSQSQSFEALTRMVKAAANFVVGKPDIHGEDLRQIADVLRLAPDDCSPNGWAVIFGVCEAYGDDHGVRILNAVEAPASLASLKRVLQWLSSHQHIGTDAAFLAYLRLLAAFTLDRRDLRGLSLRAQDGSWRPVGGLCYEVPGVCRNSLLARDQANILEKLCESSVDADHFPIGTPLVRAQVCDLTAYFAPWLRRGLGPQVGALLTIVAGRSALAKYAADLLRPRSRDWLLSEFPWVAEGLHGATARQAFERYSFVFYVAEATTAIEAHSLLGDPITVACEDTFAHLLIGQPDRLGLYPETRIYFRAIQLSRFTDAELSRLLRTTAEVLLKILYGRRLSLQQLWNAVDHTEQFHILTAEKLILEYLPFYLGLLRPHDSPQLTRLLRKVDDQRRLAVEYEGRPEAERRKKDHELGREELRHLLKSDPNVQRAVLEAVREKLRDSQYQFSSIPYELFQNADDAYVQLREIYSLVGIPQPPCRDTFVVLNLDGGLSFMHWGRAVNSLGSHGFDGRDRGYHRDLEKMLMLSASEKQIPTDGIQSSRVTGKFGLGFKSVLLACDKPVILSGNLQVEVVGGVLPRRLPETVAATLRQQMETYGPPESRTGTIVHIPEVTATFKTKILNDFLNNAGYLSAFGLAISEISYTDGESGLHTATWSGNLVAGIKEVQRGTIPANGLLSADVIKAVRIQIESGCVLFALGQGGIQPLPKGVPAVWVTGPTREDEQFGFAVCAMFDVDPGRSRLSGYESRNAELAEALGEELAAVLGVLRRLDWNRVRSDLGLDRETTAYDFWTSMWTLFQQTSARSDSAARRIMFRLLEVALAEVAGNLEVVSNGLHGDLRTLTTANSVRHKLAGVLAIEGCAAPLFGWSVWSQRSFVPEVVVSAKMAESLRLLGFNDLPSVTLATVASWLSNQTVRPNDACVLGQLLKALPDREDRNLEIKRDLEQARQALATAQFLSKARTHERANNLIAYTSNTEEGRRAAFAPDRWRLAEEYDETGIAFFRFCRGDMRTPAAELAQWALQAEDAAARRAALEYLLDGDLALSMRNELRALDVRGTWLANPADVAGVSEELLTELRRPPLAQPDQDQPPFVPVPARNPRAALERIEKWWQDNSVVKLTRYEARIYPHGQPPQLVAPWEPGFERSEWMILFGRAAFYRIGRSTDEQHRGFIERAQRTGSWSVFSAQDPKDRADEWMNVLERFCNEQIDSETWEHWMRSFPQFYKLSRWLEQYAELFLNLDRQENPYDLAAVLSPRADPGQQGGGIDAPPPSLGIGACFVIRELLRCRHIRNGFAHEHAFVPTASVRGLIKRIGLEIDDESSPEVSGQIYSQLAEHLTPQRAIFDGAYDIPFQIIAADQELERRLLDDLSGAWQ